MVKAVKMFVATMKKTTEKDGIKEVEHEVLGVFENCYDAKDTIREDIGVFDDPFNSERVKAEDGRIILKTKCDLGYDMWRAYKVVEGTLTYEE